MKDELIHDFTRRLSVCNSGEMIVILYDIYFAYEKDGQERLEAKDYEGFKQEIRRAQQVLNRLIQDLNFSYPIAKNLYRLYNYSMTHLSMAISMRRAEEITLAHRTMEGLYRGFVEAAKQDHSGPLMSNTQTVYAGMTYGRGSLNEHFTVETNRGYFA